MDPQVALPAPRGPDATHHLESNPSHVLSLDTFPHVRPWAPSSMYKPWPPSVVLVSCGTRSVVGGDVAVTDPGSQTSSISSCWETQQPKEGAACR